MAELADLTTAWMDLFRSSYNLGFHPAVLVGQTMNLDGQRALVQTPLDLLSYVAPQSVSNVDMAPNSISDWNLNNFSFSKGQGGTLILGGVGNVNGLLQIKDAQGNIIVSGDNAGSHYFNTSGNQLVRIDSTGLHGFDTSGVEHVSVTGAQGQLGLFGNTGAELIMSDLVGGVQFGLLGYYSPGNAIQLGSFNLKKLTLFGDGGVNVLSQAGDVQIGTVNSGDVVIKPKLATGFFHVEASLMGVSGDLSVLGNFAAGGTKSAIVDTSQGKRATYATESPEVWFMDFCGEKDQLNAMFAEVTEPPYHYIKCEDGEYQVWGKRKGYAKVRFEEITLHPNLGKGI